MTAAEMTGRLPALYRPDPDEEPTPLVALLAAVGAALDRGDTDAALVLQAHWLATADLAALDPYQQLAAAAGADPGFLAAHHPIRDLARIGALLALPPWPEAFPRESVEEYRTRLRRTVRLYRRGPGTLDAIRRIVEAHLPRDEALGAARADLGFGVEEAPPLMPLGAGPVPAGGSTTETAGLVGPLMRWELVQDGLDDAPATVIVEGVEPGPEVEPTVQPLVERCARSAAGPARGIGLGYRGTVPAGSVLRLRPAFSSYLGTDTGVLRADALPAEDRDADPTGGAPWRPTAAGEAPTGVVVAMARTDDAWLWALDVDVTSGDGVLRRFDGRTWSAIGDPVPGARTVAADGDALLIGTADGLLRLPGTGAGGPAMPDSVPGVAADVRAILPYSGGVLLGTADGVYLLAEGSVVRFGSQSGPVVPVRALAVDVQGHVHVGGPFGMLQFQPGPGLWYVYAGGRPEEISDDWLPLDPATGLPPDDEVFLPEVTAIHRGPGADLWLGTVAGPARYRARDLGRQTYSTVLEAFPDICPDPVHALRQDARGDLWLATGRGLLRFDGRDLWHWHDDAWGQLGRADTRYPTEDTERPRGRYRFDRGAGQWQRLDDEEQPAPGAAWPADTDQPRTAAQQAVRAIAVVDAVSADVLTGYDGVDGSYWSATPVSDDDLVVRYKPRPDLIVDGGIPALPRVPAGTSTWRYLRLEDGTPPAGAVPYWTTEGRRLQQPPPAPDEPDLPAPARFDGPSSSSGWDRSVFAYPPAARVRFRWPTRQPLTVLVRLRPRRTGGSLDPAVLDRVSDAVQRVRPAGLRVLLAVEEDLVAGTEEGMARL